MAKKASERAPTHQLAQIKDVGAFSAFLASREAKNVTGVSAKSMAATTSSGSPPG